MVNKLFIMIPVVIAALVAAYFFLVSSSVSITGSDLYESQSPQQPSQSEQVSIGETVETTTSGETTSRETSSEVATQPTTHTVSMTSSGFNPSTLTIKAGDTVDFVNQDRMQHWPASDFHPTHTLYPEIGGCIGSKFDACKGLVQGETFSFTFNIKGTWNYHDHLRPALTGTIIVE